VERINPQAEAAAQETLRIERETLGPTPEPDLNAVATRLNPELVAEHEGTLDEDNTRLCETFRLMSLKGLRGAEFLRLLHLARSEGLLTELLQAAGCVEGQVGYRRSPPVATIAPLSG